MNDPAAALFYKWQKHRFEWCMGLSVPAGLMAVTCLQMTFHHAVIKPALEWTDVDALV